MVAAPYATVTRPTGPAVTRARLIRAAEQPFAQHGLDGASPREVNRKAGRSNTGAVRYHFGDRRGLLLAVVEKHRSENEPRRHALLDQYEDDRRCRQDACPMCAAGSDPVPVPQAVELRHRGRGTEGRRSRDPPLPRALHGPPALPAARTTP